MNILNISNHEFKKMHYYKPGNIKSMESELYLIEDKNKWVKQYKLFKKYINTNKEYIDNKEYTIKLLIDQQNLIGIEEIVYPIELVLIGNEVSGYTMPFVENNVNLFDLLSSSRMSVEEKIKLLKEVGLLLERINSTGILCLSDIHEKNFIYDKDSKRIKVIDMDSCKIGNNAASISKYLLYNSKLKYFPHKYPMDGNNYIANKDTTYLSYIYMILNFISGVEYISQLPIEDYYRYLERLRNLGFDQELIDIFGLIYTKKDNISPVELLDTIPKDLTKANYRGIIRK